MASFMEVVEYIEEELFSEDVFQRAGNINTDNAIEATKRIFQNCFPGFFTPFQSGKDFGVNLGMALTSPIHVPLILGTFTAIFAIGAAVAALTFVGSLMFAAASCCFDGELAESALVINVFAGGITLACLAASLFLALSALVVAPLTLIQFATRSFASVPTLLGDAPADEENSMILAFN
ncbi:MAG: hypothetical protein H0T84_05440 [Tatlockia sp.]|nr:hypothetical protein [Tatlockia sp.]